MLLDDLVGTIETLKQRIATHGASLRENETRTRMALIDPLLQALGWDTSDPTMVAPEYSAGNGRADYALLGDAMNPVAFIEAKHFGEPLERPQHEDQLFTYALRQQVKFAALTDGNRWVLDDVSVFTGGERRLLQVSIAETPVHEAALKLLLLWRHNIASGNPVQANGPVLTTITYEGLSEPSSMNESLSSVPIARASDHSIANIVSTSKPSLPEPEWKPLSEAIPKTGDKPPSGLRFSDGSELGLRRAWAALVESTAMWLWTNNLLTLDKIPVQSSRWRYIVNAQPLHPGGNEFKQPALIDGTPLWVERNISGQVAAGNSRKLLEQCGVSLNTVFLRFD